MIKTMVTVGKCFDKHVKEICIYIYIKIRKNVRMSIKILNLNTLTRVVTIA